MISNETSVNQVLLKGKFIERLPTEILLDNKYYKTKLILDKNCKDPSLILYCTNEMVVFDSSGTETAILDFSGELQIECLNSGIDWIDASGNDWLNDLRDYFDCFPWPEIDRHQDSSKYSFKPLPLGLLDADFNSDNDGLDSEHEDGADLLHDETYLSEDDDDPFEFEKTLKELVNIKAMAGQNLDNRAEIADRMAKVFQLSLSFDKD